MSALSSLIAACDALSSDGRYAKKTRALASALREYVSSNVIAEGPNGSVSYDPDNNALIVTGLNGYAGRLQLREDDLPDNFFELSSLGTFVVRSPYGVLSLEADGRRFFGADSHGTTVGANSEPSDDEVWPGQALFWLDSTNGATRVRVKAKQDDGTVVTFTVTPD
jgi:hypothetical protein